MLTHPNAAVNSIYAKLQQQRDEAILEASELRYQIAERDVQIKALTEQLIAAAQFQSGEKLPEGAVVLSLPIGGDAP